MEFVLLRMRMILVAFAAALFFFLKKKARPRTSQKFFPPLPLYALLVHMADGRLYIFCFLGLVVNDRSVIKLVLLVVRYVRSVSFYDFQ